jgi:hypothetical protein
MKLVKKQFTSSNFVNYNKNYSMKEISYETEKPGCDYPQGAKINTLVDQITQNFVGLP